MRHDAGKADALAERFHHRLDLGARRPVADQQGAPGPVLQSA
jgi:hypothetical protein